MRRQLFFFILFLILTPLHARAWDDKETHPALTEEAVKNAKDFEKILNSQLGFEDADVKLSNGQKSLSITEWLT